MKNHDISYNLFADIGTVETLTQALSLYKRFGMTGSAMSPRTRLEYEHDLEHLISFLGAGQISKPSQVTLTHLKLYMAELERQGYRPSTRNRKAYATKGFFAFLHEWSVTKDNVASPLIPPPVERGEPRFLTEEEYTRLLQVCSHNARDRAIIELFLQTGIRLSELVGLTINDVTLPENLSSNTKTVGLLRIQRAGRGVTIPMNYKACNSVKKWLVTRPLVPSTTLFITGALKPMGKRAVQLIVQKYLNEMGIERASVQTLRHTMAVHHLVQGTDVKTLADILGDKPETLQVYVSLTRKVHQKALQEHAL